MKQIFSVIVSTSLIFMFHHAVKAQVDNEAQRNKSDSIIAQESKKDEPLMEDVEKKTEEVTKDEKADEKKIESEKEKLEKEIKKIEEQKKELEKQIQKIEDAKRELGKETKKEEKAAEPVKKEEKIVEPERSEPEKKEEKAVIPPPEEKKPLKKRLSIIDKTSKEYVALIFGYGGYFSVFDYEKSYKPAHQLSGTIGIYVLNFVGLSPELHVRYADMGSKRQMFKYNSSISLVQMFPAIVYRYAIPLPRNTLTVYARIFDGVSRVAYSSRNPYYPIFKENIQEYINTFGVSAGCYYDVWKGFLLGIDVGYSMVFTAGKPLQAVSVMVNVGWRVL